MTPAVRSLWLPFAPDPAASIRLLLAPHAGAGASVYRTWAAGLPAAIAACPVQPPGRERRRAEPPLTSAELIASQLATDVCALVKPPYALLGHSMGAICVFELCREIRRRGGTEPVHIFIAGRKAPHLPMTRTGLEHMTATELASHLRSLGGTPPEVLDDLDVVELLQPLLVADFAVNEGYNYYDEPPLSVPITAFAATDDPGATVAGLAAWETQTSAGFRLCELEGDHFAIFERQQEVARGIESDLRKWM